MSQNRSVKWERITRIGGIDHWRGKQHVVSFLRLHAFHALVDVACFIT